MRKTLFLLIVAVALAGCAADTPPQSTAGLGKLEIHPSMDSVFTNKSVGFKLVDAATGKSVKGAWWGIVSPHNVPGDRGAMRSDGRYTAPRLAPDPPTVRIEAKSEGRRVQAEFVVVNPDWPPEGTPRPGDSHLHPVYGAPPGNQDVQAHQGRSTRGRVGPLHGVRHDRPFPSCKLLRNRAPGPGGRLRRHHHP